MDLYFLFLLILRNMATNTTRDRVANNSVVPGEASRAKKRAPAVITSRAKKVADTLGISPNIGPNRNPFFDEKWEFIWKPAPTKSKTDAEIAADWHSRNYTFTR